MPELEWVADGHDPVARLERSRIAQRGRLKVGRRVLEPDQGAISLRIAPDSHGTIPFPVVPEHADFDSFSALDDMAVGQNVAGAADDEPRAGCKMDVLRRNELEGAKDLLVGFPQPRTRDRVVTDTTTGFSRRAMSLKTVMLADKAGGCATSCGAPSTDASPARTVVSTSENPAGLITIPHSRDRAGGAKLLFAALDHQLPKSRHVSPPPQRVTLTPSTLRC